MKSFIEEQFPIYEIGLESLKERKAGASQTLTGLGKYWGRKPLILVRATILGLLLPVSDNPIKDREIYLKLLTMDDEGLYRRKTKAISTKDIYKLLDDKEKNEYFMVEADGKIKYKKGISKAQKDKIQKICFNKLSYDEKLKYCCRPEEVDNVLSKEEWKEINTYLDTNAYSLQSLIDELGKKKFGHTPMVGDCFAGGGSIPFESARIGCEPYASDLNPIACLLNWANLNILSKSDEEVDKLRDFQKRVYDEVDKQIQKWGIETNEEGDRAVSYLYCNEATCPECGYKIPLSPSWVVGKGTKTIAILKNNGNKGYDIEIKSNSSNEEIKNAEKTATISKGKMICPHCGTLTPIRDLRGDRIDEDGNKIYGIRKWEKDEFINREDDLYNERLYCIRYEKTYKNEKGEIKKQRYYRSPNGMDYKREEKVIKLLNEKVGKKEDFIPNMNIEEGEKTNEPIETRGWTYWHQLFNPRQLLVHGFINETIDKLATSKEEYVIGLLGINKCADWNSKLGVWDLSTENCKNTFLNQALNPLFNYSNRGIINLSNSWNFNINNYDFKRFKNYQDNGFIPSMEIEEGENTNQNFKEEYKVDLKDARTIDKVNDLWITDPPYADAINYHELTDFFLAWDKKGIKKAFPEWYSDSKKELAVKGKGKTFNDSMIEVYSNLCKNMTNNGMQSIMFTHSSKKVWEELMFVLWLSGLKMVSSWNVMTETDSGGLKKDCDYIKGTVIMNLRKQNKQKCAYLDELYIEIENDISNQVKLMENIKNSNYSDVDYILECYSIVLKYFMEYENVDNIDIEEIVSKNNNDEYIKNIIDNIIKNNKQ